MVEVSGPTASTWLQNVITNDVRALSLSQRALYGAALNFKGRVVFDVLVTAAPSTSTSSAPATTAYWLLVDASLVDAAVEHLSKLNFRSKVRIVRLSHVSAWNILSASPSYLDLEQRVAASSDATVAFLDPRSPLLGAIFLSDHSNAPSAPPPPMIAVDSPRLRLLHLTLHTVPWLTSTLLTAASPASPVAPTSLPLPLELSLHRLHGVAFDKGCYLGQEVTARAHFTGQLRKRLYSAMLHSPGSRPAPSAGPLPRLRDRRDGDGLFAYRGIDWVWSGGDLVGSAVSVTVDGALKEAGRVWQGVSNVVMCMLRTEYVERRACMWVTGSDGRRWELDVYEADWWPSDEQQQQAKEEESGALFEGGRVVEAEQLLR